MTTDINDADTNPVEEYVSTNESTRTPVTDAGAPDRLNTTSDNPEPPEDELSALRQELAAKTVEAETYFNRLQRLQADFENYRRRTRREQEDLFKYASEGIVTGLLPVLDNLERALAAGTRGGDLAAFLDGIQMIYRQLWGLMEKQELSPIETVGQVFDPGRHHAVAQVETGDYAENTVVEEMQKGYCFKDRVIRPALVKVAKPEQQ